MSEPKPERIAEATARELLDEAEGAFEAIRGEWASEWDGLRLTRLFVEDWRRLRGLIVKAHASTAFNPWGQEELRAEADAIRAEKNTGA